MRTLSEYLALPYHIQMVRDETDEEPQVGWVAWVEELPGCASQGDTPEEAASMIREAMHAWLSAMLEDGDPIPEPRRESTHSGRYLVRMPRGLHAALDATARAEGVSLNQYINSVLAGAVGYGAAEHSRRAS